MSPELIAAVRLTGDAIGAVGFVVAIAIFASIPFSGELKGEYVIKALVLASMLIYAIVLTFAVMGKLGLPAISDLLEDNFEVLYPLVALGLVFAVYSAQQFTDVLRSQKALASSHELMMDIVDGAPAGIMFLSPVGTIVFANETAQAVLDLSEDRVSGDLTGPGWFMEGSDRPQDLSLLVSDRPYSARSVTIRWPDGRALDLIASGAPRSDGRGELGGVAVSFERPAPRGDR
jgi:PAS domain-containing protein